jgi:hypothetical protein
MKKALALALVAGTVLVLAGCTQGETESATDVTATGATLRAKGSCEQGDYGQWWFEYREGSSGTWEAAGPRRNYGPPESSFECPDPNVEVSQVVNGLSPRTSHQFRICGTNPPGWGNAVEDCADRDGNLTNDPPSYDTFTTDPSFGVSELKDQLNDNNIPNVPVEAVQFIVGAGEALENPPYETAKDHVEMLLANHKLPITTLNADDFWSIPVPEWEDRVAKFVQHVPSRIVEIGNEPGTYVPDGQVYAVWNRYFDRVRAAARKIPAGKKLILGGQPPGSSQPGGYPGAAEFFERANVWRDELGRPGIWRYVDGVGLHPYMPTPSTQYTYIRDRRTQLTNLGFTGPSSAFYLQLGWGSGPYASGGLNVGPDQDDHLKTAFTNLRNNSGPANLRIATVLWYSWKDWTEYGTRWDHRAGVRDWYGQPKPSYCALRDVANAPPIPTCPLP